MKRALSRAASGIENDILCAFTIRIKRFDEIEGFRKSFARMVRDRAQKTGARILADDPFQILV